MNELAVYILEQAHKAHDEQLSEEEFLAQFDERALGATKVRLPSITQAMTEIRRGGQWPWPAPSEPRPSKPPPADEIAARREAVVSAIRELAAASQDLTYLFGRLGLDMGGDAIEQIERGVNALDLVRSMSLADRRETLQAAAARLQGCRHEFQRAMFLLSAAQGEPMAEIARAWRVSRQLVSRTIKEKG
jgi:Homeodomain-like domain-containing protein